MWPALQFTFCKVSQKAITSRDHLIVLQIIVKLHYIKDHKKKVACLTVYFLENILRKKLLAMIT